MQYRSLLVALALAASVNSQFPEMSALNSKWKTVSGYSEFSRQLDKELLNYVSTQTFVPVTAVLASGPNVELTGAGAQTFGLEAISVVTHFAATATEMAPSDRAELLSDYLALMIPTSTLSAPADSTTPSTSNYTVATTPVATYKPGSAAGLARMDLLSVSCGVAALIAAIAVAL